MPHIQRVSWCEKAVEARTDDLVHRPCDEPLKASVAEEDRAVGRDGHVARFAEREPLCACVLAREGVLGESIMVGICHPEGFSEENNTLRDFDLSPELGGAAYAQFVATELVAHMDGHYRTMAQAEARTLGGFSLGALNCFFTALRHSGVFSKYVLLSTAFEDISGAPPAHSVQVRALTDEPALPLGAKMYLDYGSIALDECYEPYYRDVGSLFREKGWKDGEQFLIRRIEGGTHDEISWRQRLGDGLRFVSR